MPASEVDPGTEANRSAPHALPRETRAGAVSELDRDDHALPEHGRDDHALPDSGRDDYALLDSGRDDYALPDSRRDERAVPELDRDEHALPDPDSDERALPDSDPDEHALPDPDPDAPWAAVVARWNPQGSALLRAVADESACAAALLIGADDANTLLLRTELARLEPRVELDGPVADPARASAAVVAVVVLDAGSPLGAGTLALVEELHTAGSRMLFVLDGTHAHPEWPAVADRDRELLTPVLGAPPDLVPVSPRLAVAARSAADPALLDRSGLAALHGRLLAATGGGRSHTAVDRVLAETRQRIRDQMAVLTSGAEEARLRAERAALTADRDGGRTRAMATLRNRLQLARVELLHEAGARVRTLHAAARTELDRHGVPGCPDRLQQAVDRLTAELDTVVAARLAELDRQLTALTEPDSGPPPTAPPRPDPPPVLGPDPEPRHRGVEDHLMVALGASAGFGLGRWVVAPLTALPALHYASVPVTLLLGGAVAYWVVRARGQVADRAHMRQWIADALVNVRAQLEQRVATALVEAESELTDQVVRVGTARAVEADRRAAEIAAQLRRLATESPARLAACDRDLALLM
ncbi:hypothetical protein [Nocardia sp. BMG111209]|uniref:hypothetical protein n=1 Tax=Nocardia sp. BMG111209 TaxID=1160137 RepID=UPI00036FAD74|nr:hypothetical protein [Nocardia sp. BMG111209]